MFNDKIREYIKKENEYDQEQIEREGNVHAREHIDHQIQKTRKKVISKAVMESRQKVVVEIFHSNSQYQ